MVEAAPNKVDLARLLTASGVSATPWYAVIDAAQDSGSPARAAGSGLQTQSLYEGSLGQQLDDVAPHLVSLTLRDEFAGWLFDNWGGNHGILLQARAGFQEIRRHLRKFLMVKDEAGKKYRFRYYDPRVLRTFLPACSPAEARDFFGPVACYYAANRDGRSALAFSWRSRGVAMREIPEGEPAG